MDLFPHNLWKNKSLMYLCTKCTSFSRASGPVKHTQRSAIPTRAPAARWIQVAVCSWFLPEQQSKSLGIDYCISNLFLQLKELLTPAFHSAPRSPTAQSGNFTGYCYLLNERIKTLPTLVWGDIRQPTRLPYAAYEMVTRHAEGTWACMEKIIVIWALRPHTTLLHGDSKALWWSAERWTHGMWAASDALVSIMSLCSLRTNILSPKPYDSQCWGQAPGSLADSFSDPWVSWIQPLKFWGRKKKCICVKRLRSHFSLGLLTSSDGKVCLGPTLQDHQRGDLRSSEDLTLQHTLGTRLCLLRADEHGVSLCLLLVTLGLGFLTSLSFSFSSIKWGSFLPIFQHWWEWLLNEKISGSHFQRYRFSRW